MTQDRQGCCCPPSDPTPAPVHNRPGLGEIAYRSGTWRDFRRAMRSDLSALSTSTSPLADLRTRASDDPTIALLDAWAVACDVLTFYTERLAQESYLRTATEPVSLQEMGRLIGYRPDPGVAAETRIAFTIERPPALPIVPADPGLAPPPTPGEVTLPVGLRVQSIPGPGETPETFETVEQITARPEWSSLPVARTRPGRPAFGDRTAWLRGTPAISAGAAFLVTDRTPATTDFARDHWDFRLLTEVSIDRELDATQVRFEWRLGAFDPRNLPAAQPTAWVLRKRFTVFGHNAPVWPALDPSYREGYARSITSDAATLRAIRDAGEWHDFTSTTTGGGNAVVIDLDGPHADIVRGSWVVVSQEDDTFYRELYEVIGRAELSRAEFGISGTVTRLTLRGEARAFGTPRQVTVFGVSEPLELTEPPDFSAVTGDELVVDGDATAMKPGRVVCVSTPALEGMAEVAIVLATEPEGVAPSGTPRTRLRLQANLARSYDRSGTVVLGNVVTATHGETVHEILGSGDARRPFQTFALTQGPVTFVQAANADGAASSLRVGVDGIEWPEARNHYGAEPTDRSFTHARSAEPNPATGLPYDLVAFGDGVHGARVTTGSHNVRATYRKGLGAVGNLAANRLAQPLDRPLGVRAATNPVPATGGADPETPGVARVSMPASVRTLGRAVSLEDYADFALTFSGISRANARVLPLRSGRTVVVSVCGPDAGAAATSTISHLQLALAGLGDPLVAVRVVAADIVHVRLDLAVGIHPAYDQAAVLEGVRAALHSTFEHAARELARPLAASRVIATAAGVAGVTAVDLNRLYRADSHRPVLNQRLLASTARVTPDGSPLGAELLGLAPDSIDRLAVLT